MGDLFLVSERQMARVSPFFPLSHGVPRVDDRRVVSGIVCVIRNGLQWKDAPAGYGPHKTLYNRFIHWSLMGVFDSIFAGLAGEGPKPQRIMIDTTRHRTTFLDPPQAEVPRSAAVSGSFTRKHAPRP
jgi:transposase